MVTVGTAGVDHVLLTRFNLPTTGVEGLVRAREGWLSDRVALFERYCTTSVARQSLPVTWIVYLDPESPGWLFDRLRPHVDAGVFRPVLRTSVDAADLAADLREAIPRHSSHLLTTNLDNDDGLATDFVARLRSVAPRPGPVAVYLTRGLIVSGSGVYLRTDRHNAFCSVLEPWGEERTSWSEYHNQLGQVMPVVQLGGAPAWLQVVHGANVSNRVRGRLVAPRPYRSRFGHLLDDEPHPSRGEVIADALVQLPARTIRDAARAGARTALLRLLGKERYQTLKLQLSARPTTGP